MRPCINLFLTALLILGSSAAFAQQGSRGEICVPVEGGSIVLRADGRIVPIDIDSLIDPAGPQPALCCSSCSEGASGIECTGCVNLPTFSDCFGKILNCPDGEILTEDGEGSCA